MQFVIQTKFTDEDCSIHGNCMAACIASLIGVPLTSVPAWEDMGEDGSWGDSFIAFLGANGFSYEGLFTGVDPSVDWWAELIKRSPGVDGYFIVGGKSPRLVGRGHAVIFKGGIMVHDPHPSGEGLASIEEVYMIEHETQRSAFVASSYDAGVTVYHSVEPDFGGKARILATVGLIADDEITRLTADGLVLLWRHGSYAFLARPEANEVGAKPGMAQMLDLSQFTLSLWAKWVSADAYGYVWEYEFEPKEPLATIWFVEHGRFNRLRAIDMTGIDWRQTLTPVNQAQEPRPATIDIAHSHTYPLLHCDCGMAFVLLGHVADTVMPQGEAAYCPCCGKAQQPVVRTAPTDIVTLFVTLWQQLNGMQERDVAAAMVRDDLRRADGFFTTLGAAIEAMASPQTTPMLIWRAAADAAVNPANIVGIGPTGMTGPMPDSGSLYRYDEELDD